METYWGSVRQLSASFAFCCHYPQAPPHLMAAQPARNEREREIGRDRNRDESRGPFQNQGVSSRPSSQHLASAQDVEPVHVLIVWHSQMTPSLGSSLDSLLWGGKKIDSPHHLKSLPVISLYCELILWVGLAFASLNWEVIEAPLVSKY